MFVFEKVLPLEYNHQSLGQTVARLVSLNLFEQMSEARMSGESWTARYLALHVPYVFLYSGRVVRETVWDGDSWARVSRG